MRSKIRQLVRKGLGERLFASFRGLYWSVKLKFVDYEPETRALRFLVPKSGICLDVGSNFGQFAGFLSRAVGPDGKVYCFEPVPYNREVFATVMRHLGWQNVHLSPYALGNRIAIANLVIPRLNTAEAHVVQSSEGLAVEMVTLDHWAEQVQLRRVDLLKIDVEGYELFVLEGARDVLITFRPVVLCEVTGASQRYGRSPQELFNFLSALNYCSFIWLKRRLVPSSAPQNGAINYIFIHADQQTGLRGLIAP